MMDNEEKTTEEKEHYICYGGCKGVSDMPGICGAPDCADYGQPLHDCNCPDGKHNDFQAAE